MIIYLPYWVSEQLSSTHGISVHPSGLRIAVSNQNGAIRIYYVRVLRERIEELIQNRLENAKNNENDEMEEGKENESGEGENEEENKKENEEEKEKENEKERPEGKNNLINKREKQRSAIHNKFTVEIKPDPFSEKPKPQTTTEKNEFKQQIKFEFKQLQKTEQDLVINNLKTLNNSYVKKTNKREELNFDLFDDNFLRKIQEIVGEIKTNPFFKNNNQERNQSKNSFITHSLPQRNVQLPVQQGLQSAKQTNNDQIDNLALNPNLPINSHNTRLFANPKIGKGSVDQQIPNEVGLIGGLETNNKEKQGFLKDLQEKTHNTLNTNEMKEENDQKQIENKIQINKEEKEKQKK